MIRATTPTHTFKIKTDTDNVSKLKITYAQDGEIILSKTLSDCTVGDHQVSVKLTQQETKLFHEGTVTIQMRVKTNDGTVIPTPKYYRKVEDVLDDEVL